MSVASRNPFSLLDAEDSSRPASPAPAPKAAAPAAPAPSANRGQQKPRTGPSSRGGKYYARGGKPAPKDGAAPAAEEPVDGKKPESGRGGRGPRGGRGGDRGAARGGKRPFDRHSASGKTDSQKKVHQGWGGDEGNTELLQETAAEVDANAETTEVAPAEGQATPAEEAKPKVVEEEEDNTLTLDQYLAQKAAKELAIPKVEPRQANEGANDDLWKDAVAISKDEEESYFVGKAKSAPKPKAKKEEKVFLEIDARFERPSTGGRGGRGGRGGDRGAPRGGERRGRGAPRAPRGGRQNGAPAPNVDDQSAFPSLA